MSKPKIILFSGAKECGKDVALDHLMSYYVDLEKAECKDVLHQLTQTLFNVSEDRYWEIYNDRNLKEKPLPEFRVKLNWKDWLNLEDILDYNLTHSFDGTLVNTYRDLSGQCLDLSIREALIYVSEIIVKTRWGKGFFGKARASSLKDGYIYVDGSCGFSEELPPLIGRVGQENILLLRIHRDGYTFEGDSRELIPDGVIDNTVDIYNNGTLEEYLDKVKEEVDKWLL